MGLYLILDIIVVIAVVVIVAFAPVSVDGRSTDFFAFVQELPMLCLCPLTLGRAQLLLTPRFGLDSDSSRRLELEMRLALGSSRRVDPPHCNALVPTVVTYGRQHVLNVQPISHSRQRGRRREGVAGMSDVLYVPRSLNAPSDSWATLWIGYSGGHGVRGGR